MSLCCSLRLCSFFLLFDLYKRRQFASNFMKSWLKAIIKNQNMKKIMTNLLGIVKQQQAPSTFEVFLPLIWSILQKVLILQILIWTGPQLKRIALHTQTFLKKMRMLFYLLFLMTTTNWSGLEAKEHKQIWLDLLNFYQIKIY